MVITGYIESITPFTYEKEGRKLTKYHILVCYSFYGVIHHILFTATNQLEIPDEIEELFHFDFQPITRYIHGKVFTDFYLHNVTKAIRISDQHDFMLIETTVQKQNMHVLKTEQIKERTKVTVEIVLADGSILHAFYWKNNKYLDKIEGHSWLQICCKSLQYKDKWINNMEVWRAMKKNSFVGSIL